MSRLLVLLSAIAFALVLLIPEPAHAQDDQFQTLVDRGLDHYRARQFDEAVQSFEAAYKIRQEPELLYNIARSYEKAANRERAIDAYRRFLELKGTTAELRANARTALDALERERNAEQNPARTVPAERVETTRPADNNDATSVTTTRPAGKSHALEYAMMAGGGVAVATGVIFTVLAFQAKSDFDNETDRDEQIRLRSSTKRNSAIADVLVIGGAVLGGAGAILYLTSDDDEGEVAAGPTFDGDTFAFSLSGTF